jgi:hypothetical protein
VASTLEDSSVDSSEITGLGAYSTGLIILREQQSIRKEEEEAKITDLRHETITCGCRFLVFRRPTRLWTCTNVFEAGLPDGLF